MNNCDYDIMNYWGCCQSIDLSHYATNDDIEKLWDALEDIAISGECECDLTEVEAQIQALQGAIVSIDDTLPLKADLSALTATNDRVTALENSAPDLSDYYTKDEVDTTVDDIYDNMANNFQSVSAQLSSLNKKVNDHTSSINASVSGVTKLNEGSDHSFGISVEHNNGAKENRRWYLGYGLTTPDSGNTIQVDQSIIIGLQQQITALAARVAALESGGTTPDTGDTPTPDTGETITDKAVIYNTDGTSRTVAYTGTGMEFINEQQTFPSGEDRSLVGSVVIGDRVWGLGVDAFSNCINMSAVTLSEGLESIGVDTFKNDVSLTSITIPSTVTGITPSSFSGCTGLTTMTLLPTTPPTIANSEYSTAFANANTLYVPSESVTAYQTAWPDIASKIHAIV